MSGCAPCKLISRGVLLTDGAEASRDRHRSLFVYIWVFSWWWWWWQLGLGLWLFVLTVSLLWVRRLGFLLFFSFFVYFSLFFVLSRGHIIVQEPLSYPSLTHSTLCIIYFPAIWFTQRGVQKNIENGIGLRN